MESISKISGILDAAREFTMEAAHNVNSIHSRTLSQAPSTAQINALLESKSESEVIEGLQNVVTLLYSAPEQAVTHFTAVVKAVSFSSYEIRKLVGLIVVQLTPRHPDSALLTINILQKSLTDPSSTLRAQALRTMSSIKVPAIAQIVLLAVKRGLTDPSATVRRTAAFSIPKALRLSASTLEEPLKELLSELLRDESALVTGAAVQVLASTWRDDLDLVHPNFRVLVRQMVDMDEWAQLALMRVLLPYCRRCFIRPDESSIDPDLELFLRCCVPLLSSRNSGVILAATRCLIYLGNDPLVEYAASRSLALLRSPTADILPIALQALSQIAAHKPKAFSQHASRLLIKESDSAVSGKHKIGILTSIYPYVSRINRELILTELRHLIIAATPHAPSRDVLLAQAAVRAIGDCAQSVSTTEPENRKKCLGMVLNQLSPTNGRKLASSITAELLSIVRRFVAPDEQELKSVAPFLALQLEDLNDSASRSTILWLIGELTIQDPESQLPIQVLNHVLIEQATRFPTSAEETRLQVYTLAVKVYFQYLLSCAGDLKASLDESESSSPMLDWKTTPNLDSAEMILYAHALRLIHFDSSTDIRDRLRTLTALLPEPQQENVEKLTPVIASNLQLTQLVLTPTRLPPSSSADNDDEHSFGPSIIGTASDILFHKNTGSDTTRLAGALKLPEWATDPSATPASLRDVAPRKSAVLTVLNASSSDYSRRAGAASAGRAGHGPASSSLKYPGPAAAAAAAPGVGGKEKSLDDWLNESDETESETESGSGGGGDGSAQATYSDQSSSSSSSSSEDDDDDDDDDGEDEEETEEEDDDESEYATESEAGGRAAP